MSKESVDLFVSAAERAKISDVLNTALGGGATDWINSLFHPEGDQFVVIPEEISTSQYAQPVLLALLQAVGSAA